MKATVKLYHDRQDDYSDVEPDQTKEIEVTEECLSDRPMFADEEWIEADDVYNHKYYAIDCECDEAVTLYVHTNDSVHDPDDWGRAAEGGLIYDPEDDYPPFGCEMWGRTCFWVKSNA
ncbi:hypothetical protein [Natrinema sp. DC36]|uniref:hypothetical protein n=1 Tax=Natrinema sp. DC36 TaxID=2878680 RepID=UPI001CF0537E|nr:hypothetical protein [Natrinema sp. DC36]